MGCGTSAPKSAESSAEKSLWKPAEKDYKLRAKGKLKEHQQKHGIKQFSTKNSKDYSKMAMDFGTKESTSILQTEANGFIYRYEPATDKVFVGTKTGRIKTFYKWDGREDDDVINLFRELGMI